MYEFSNVNSKVCTPTSFSNRSSFIRTNFHGQFCQEPIGVSEPKTQKRACKICLTQFYTLNDLMAHVNSGVHAVKRYACESCNKRFVSIGYLIQHLDATGHISSVNSYQQSYSHPMKENFAPNNHCVVS